MTGTTDTISRRGFLAAGVAAVGGGAIAASATPAAAQSGYGGWFSGVSNYDGTVDRTGNDRVTVEVGVQANGGAYGFGPAAVQVDPGTTVVWEWTGEGNQHNVVAQDGGFESELVSEAGHTFEHTFEEGGVYEYYCSPHEPLGMKGVVVVGDNVPEGAAAGSGSGGGSGGGSGSGMAPSAGVADGNVTLSIPYQFVMAALSLGMLVAVAIGAQRLFSHGYEPSYHPGSTAGGSAADRAVGSGEAAGELVGRTEGVPVKVRHEDDLLAREIGHDEFDPRGTLALVLGYFAILVLLWGLMYFVEFLGNGPTVIG